MPKVLGVLYQNLVENQIYAFYYESQYHDLYLQRVRSYSGQDEKITLIFVTYGVLGIQ